MIEMLIIMCRPQVEENHTKKYNNKILLDLLALYDYVYDYVTKDINDAP